MSWKKTIIISLLAASVAFYAGRCSQEIQMKKSSNEVTYQQTGQSEQSIDSKLENTLETKYIQVNDKYFRLESKYETSQNQIASYQKDEK